MLRISLNNRSSSMAIVSVYHENLHELNSNALGHCDHIRLLRPGRSSWMGGREQLWDLRTFPLLTAPSFAAMSYSWGKRPTTSTIRLNTGSSTHKFPITDDLSNALARMRKANKHNWLWVDAICINQNADDEKSDQVGRMRSIYGIAKRVFVWLGEEIADTRPQAHQPQLTQNSTHYPDIGITFAKMEDMLSQGASVWWARLWVLQEVAFCEAVNVCIGRRVTPWDTFRHAFYELRLLPEDMHPDLAKFLQAAKDQLAFLGTLRNNLRRGKFFKDIKTLLYMTQPQGVSNPLDRVYSLLGLATEEICRDIPIKYGASLAEVFADVVSSHVEKSGSIDILFDQWSRGQIPESAETNLRNSSSQSVSVPSTSSLAATASNETNYSLPTWLPDFSKPLVRPLPGEYKYWAGTCYASGNTKPITKFANGSLRLGAVFCDSIYKVYPSFSELMGSQMLNSGACQERVEGVDAVRCTGDFVQTTQTRPQAVDHTLDLARNWLRSSLHDGACFITESGMVGISSKHVIEGDEIIVPFGCSYPAVIRPCKALRSQNSARKIYNLVEECYVSGMMAGELMALQETEQIKGKIYELR